jgi:hypothetical protein
MLTRPCWEQFHRDNPIYTAIRVQIPGSVQRHRLARGGYLEDLLGIDGGNNKAQGNSNEQTAHMVVLKINAEISCIADKRFTQ